MEDESRGEYTKFESKIQLGDGVDQRGDMRVEILRERRTGNEPGMNVKQVELPGGEKVSAVADDEAFAEFYFEMGRARTVLTEALGLDDSE